MASHIDGTLSQGFSWCCGKRIGERSFIRPLDAANDRGPWWRSRIEFQIISARCERDDAMECFDPSFLTICHHTLVALPVE